MLHYMHFDGGSVFNILIIFNAYSNLQYVDDVRLFEEFIVKVNTYE